jgi:hypothetical protein
MELVSLTGLPAVEGVSSVSELPHTISTALLYRARINSFNELPEEKRPPRNLWDKPHRLAEFFDKMFEPGNSGGPKNFLEFDMEEVE